MKRFFYLMLFLALTVVSCSKDEFPDGLDLKNVTVQLVYPENNNDFTAHAGVAVKMLAGNSSSFEATTDANGTATFEVPAGVYDIVASDKYSDGTTSYVYNGAQNQVVISSSWSATDVIELELTESTSGQVIIKEIFAGGSLKDDGSGVFSHDAYIILYNNSEETAILDNVCIGIIAPYNSQAQNGFVDPETGELSYEREGWIPAAQAYWHFQNSVSLQPGKQLVIALSNAVDNTITYSKSINFNNPEYYCTYDINKFSSTTAYVTPGDSIPTSHYLLAEVYGRGKAWANSVTSPGFFLFTPKDGYTATSFAADAATLDESTLYPSRKVPMNWVVDGVEVFAMDVDVNTKRFPASIDAGNVLHTNNLGYSVYRNVDKEATEAIEGNAGKLVYSYDLGTTDVNGGSTDPSGIDAEASRKNGAHIIYKDTQNSTNDFHLRKKASLSNYE